ncbi:MAG: twin-arginine translocase subunit TatC [Bacteroidota bacterium]|nr:twin-arginine translocase subunit TatC [Bacteroidota bacterium]MDP4215426.1 twin-arginine translocase subunit TatC [Bacteroidota bacterium]MDP4245914.1 twin-arginine translocase subunit TatC [Bacteroidota bacterium]MDP4254835.1 twin-arginine translocase subunit TatC [Bacteroidota bacterium]MDP4256732.1 twin-arginine translocase subunit TatC [Bacteroidota bacterium]
MKLFKRRGEDGSGAEMSFIEHLDVLRGHLFKSAVAVAIGAVIVAIYNNFIFKKILMGPTKADFPTYSVLCRLSEHLGLGNKLCMTQINVKMQSNTVAGQFGVYFNIILIGGFILAFPYVFWQFWKFTKPALTSKELRSTRGVIFWVSLLFFLGVFFGYFVIAPYTINFFSKFSLDDSIENLWTIASYFNTITPLILGAGLAFQLPLVIYFLARAGVVSAAWLRRARKYAIISMLVLAGIITPPDMLSQIVCTIPLMLLYEIGVLLCVRVEKQEKKKEAEWS